MNSVTVSQTNSDFAAAPTTRRRVLPKKSGAGVFLLRLGGALTLTILLVAFLVFTRWLDSGAVPELTIRTLETIAPVTMQAPPPPPPASEPPPPPPPEMVPLPKLDIQINSPAPPMKATLENRIDLDMAMPEFAPANDQPRERMLFSSKELDSQPRLINRPTATFPKSQSERGVTEGKVTLEVVIGASGKVTVRRVLDSSHPDFTVMARSFATRARFSPPKKEGRSVSSLFRWPLVLKP